MSIFTDHGLIPGSAGGASAFFDSVAPIARRFTYGGLSSAYGQLNTKTNSNISLYYSNNIQVRGFSGSNPSIPVSMNALHVYTDEMDGVDIVAFADQFMTMGAYFTFIDGKVANAGEEVDAEIVIARAFDPTNNIDRAIFCDSISKVVEEDRYCGSISNRGYCDKYIVSPFAYRGIIGNANTYTVDGGRGDIANGICTIDNKNFYRASTNILVQVDSLIGG